MTFLLCPYYDIIIWAGQVRIIVKQIMLVLKKILEIRYSYVKKKQVRQSIG